MDIDIRELYVVGDKKRLVVQSLLRDLEKTEMVIHVIAPIPDLMKSLPEKEIHLVLCLSDTIDFDVVRRLSERIDRTGMHLYIAGTINGMTINDESFLKRVPGHRFNSWPLDLNELLFALKHSTSAEKRLLVVDDEPMLLRSIKTWLEKDFKVSLVNSGATALDFLKKNIVDLILLDFEMPEMSGPELLKHIRANPATASIPVIFLTAKDDKNSVMAAIDRKPDGYILKSQSPEGIRNSIRAYFKMEAAED